MSEPRYMGGQAVLEGVLSERREAGIPPSSERGLAARLRRSQERYG
jgi:hypothetical protein